MRPHTRTQCTDGKECLECGSSGEASLAKATATAATTMTHSHQHEGAIAYGGGGGVGGGGPDANGSGGGIGASASPASNFSFVAPSSGRPRRSKAVATAQTKSLTPPSAHAKAAIACRSVLLVELPAELLVKILNCMSFKEISQVRLVSRRFNEICASMLNTTFQRLQSCMLSRFQSIKGQMPRRESARRNHPLARECDIVETLHMRLTLLQMTFGKHIERKHICFFAGEILDEVKRILRYVRQTPSLVNIKAYKITDELFDLSTMAMEYFKEHIEPTLPEITYFGTEFLDFAAPFTAPLKRRSQSGGANVLGCDSVSACSSRASVAGSSSSSDHWSVSSNAGNCDDFGFDPMPPPQSNVVLRKRIRRIRQGMKRYNNQLVEVKRDLKSCKSKMESQVKQVQDYSSRLEEYDKKFEESSRKFQTLLTELNKCKTELQYWRSKSTGLLSLPPTCSRCNAPVVLRNLPPMKSGGGDDVDAADAADGDDAEAAAAAAADSTDALDEVKVLSNQGAFLSGEADAAAADGTESSKDCKQVQTQPPAPAASSATDGGGGGMLVPADGKAVARSKNVPASPGYGGRKRRSRDDLMEICCESEPGLATAGTRKSLRGVGVKSSTRGKRSKLSATGNQ